MKTDRISQTFLFFQTKIMTKHISDSERLLQSTLNRKYLELEQKDKEIKQLQREKDVLLSQKNEDKETINQLCRQISYLLLKQNQNA